MEVKCGKFLILPAYFLGKFGMQRADDRPKQTYGDGSLAIASSISWT